MFLKILSVLMLVGIPIGLYCLTKQHRAYLDEELPGKLNAVSKIHSVYHNGADVAAAKEKVMREHLKEKNEVIHSALKWWLVLTITAILIY